MSTNKINISGQIFLILLILMIGLVLFSCANRTSGPTGGPKDSIPPVVLKESPVNGALNFMKKQIEIHFNENIQIEKATENVIVSPPQLKSPEVKSNGKSLLLQLQDELEENTTYTINFGNAIVDLNEKNPLKNYSFSFSTGNEIDTLRISGIVINAQDLSPVKGIIVGIYKEDDDSAFFEKKFLRISKTDENGRFEINNIRKGSYSIYALGDLNHDYFYQQGEEAAFIDSLVSPLAVSVVKSDTIWKDSLTVDTIKSRSITKFEPQNILFKLFKENFKRQYLVKSERKQKECFSLYFNTKQSMLPEIKPLNFNWDSKFILQKNATLDSLTYWLTDTLIVNQDTLQMTVSYLKTDSLNQLSPVSDTLSVIMKHPRVNPKQKVVVNEDLNYKFFTNLNGLFDSFLPVQIKFETPLKTFDINKIHLLQKIDSIYKELKYNWKMADSSSLLYTMEYKWEPDKSYELVVDSAAFASIYDKVNNKLSTQFKIKSLNEYSGIKIILLPLQENAVIQVLDTKDKVVVQKPCGVKETRIEFLKPGDYYLRLFIDENKNGIWDPGNVKQKIEPEKVFYYSKKLSLMANWDFEETWDVTALPILQQKPKELYMKPENKQIKP